LNGVEAPYYLARDALFLPDLHGQRDRAAVSAAVQWTPNSSSQYTFEFFWNRYEEEIQNNLLFTFVDWWGSLGPDPASTFELFEGTNIIKSRTAGDVFGFNSGDFTKSRTDSFVYAFNADWEIGDSTGVTLDLSHQNSEFNTLFLANRITRVAPQVTYDTNPGNMIPSLSFGNNALLFDPSAWTLGEFYDNANRSEGDAWTAHLDAVHEFDESFVDTIKVGVRYDDRGASDLVRTQDAPALGRPFSSLDDSYIFTGSRYFNGRADVPTRWISPRGRTIYENADEYRRLYQSVDPLLQLSDELELVRVFDISEVSKAAYIQVDTEFEVFGRPLFIQYGVRYVDVDTDLTFIDRITAEELSDSQSTSGFLPSATVRFDITDTFRLRFNYGETLRRPTFSSLNPFLQLTGDLTNIGRGSGTGGNAGLQPTTSKNYDLGAEWYFSPGSALYATLFRREIEGLVVPFTSVIDFPTDPLGEGTTRFAVTRPENASDGKLEGVEVGFTYFPEYLPGLLDGLGVQGSLTVLDSLQNIPQTDTAGNVIGQDESPFFGVSDFSYNVTLAYDNSGLGLRLSYVWRDEFLSANEARLFANPIGFWRTPEESLDFQLTYALTDTLGVTFDAVNLTNDVQQQYYRFGDVGNAEQFNTTTTLLPRTFAFGLRYTFE
jgi:TonB-dependent receptor